MRKPILAPSAGALSPLLYSLMLYREAVSVTIKKVPSRVKRIAVDTTHAESWREYIETN